MLSRRPDRTRVPDVHGGAVDALAASATAGLPLYDFTAEDGAHHLARVRRHRGGPRCGGWLRAPRGVGLPHARGAAETGGERPRRHVPGRRVPAPIRCRFLAYNRLVNDFLGSHPASRKSIEAVGKTHQLTPGPAVPAKEGRGVDVRRRPRSTVPLESSSGHSPSDSLDVSLLHLTRSSAPCLGIGDERTDKRIDFVVAAAARSALDTPWQRQGGGRVLVVPASVKDLMAISDAGEISTAEEHVVGSATGC